MMIQQIGRKLRQQIHYLSGELCTGFGKMTVLVLAASYFAAVWLGTRAKLNILDMHAMNAAKRIFGIPDFWSCPFNWLI